MSSAQPLPYSNEPRPEDTEKAWQILHISMSPNDAYPLAVNFSGNCPRCGHSIQIRKWLSAVVGGGTQEKDLPRRSQMGELVWL
jgi:hypothetical protein